MREPEFETDQPDVAIEDFRSQIKRYYHELGVAIVAVALGLPIEDAESLEWGGEIRGEPAAA